LSAHPRVGDFYGALTGAKLEREVTRAPEDPDPNALCILRVYEPSWRDHQARLLLTKGPAGKARDRRRRPRRVRTTVKSLQNPRRWELLEDE
jgi:hypothetical protein